MGDLDTDSKMMREQQNRDAPETIEADEAGRHRSASDLDREDRLAREAAGAGRTLTDEDGQDAVLRQNRERVQASHGETAQDGKPEPDLGGGLARPDRSILEP